MLTEDVRLELLSEMEALRKGISNENCKKIWERFNDVFVANTDLVSDLGGGISEDLEALESEEASTEQQDPESLRARREALRSKIVNCIERATTRLESLRNRPVDASFDALIERRVDAVVEKNVTVKWVRRFGAVVLGCAAIFGSATGAGLAWMFVENARSAVDRAAGKVESIAGDTLRQFERASDEIKNRKTSLDNDVKDARVFVEMSKVNFESMVTARAEASAAEKVSEVESKLEDLFDQTAAKIEKIDLEIAALRPRPAMIEKVVTAFESETNGWIEKSRNDFRSRFEDKLELAKFHIDDYVAGVKERLVQFDNNVVEMSMTNLSGRTADLETAVETFEKKLGEQIAKGESDVATVRQRVDAVIATAVTSVESAVAAQTPNAIQRVDTAVNDSIANMTSELGRRAAMTIEDVVEELRNNGQDFGAQLDAALRNTKDMSLGIRQSWEELRTGVSDAAASAMTRISNASDEAANKLEKNTDMALENLPVRVASLESAVKASEGAINARSADLDELRGAATKIEGQMSTFKAMVQVLDGKEQLSSGFIKLGLFVVRDTFYVTLVVGFLTIFLSLWGVRRLAHATARDAAKNASAGP